MIKSKIPQEINPLLKRMDQSLKKFKVRRQQWHGGTFIGNHVNKCLKVNDITKCYLQITTCNHTLQFAVK